MTTITQTITALPAAPDPAADSPATFSTKAAASVLAQKAMVPEINTWAGQANALAASMNSVAAGAATSIPYTFSTTTADADPGNGFLRLDNATQNIATTIRTDLVGSDASTWTALLDIFDDSTSAIKGFIMLMKSGDATKWLVFSVSALASPAGYKNITAANVASSAASPFTDGDSLILKFTRTGDKGETGATGTVGDHAVTVHSGNGYGSTNTVIRRFTTTQSSAGTAITYADSATLGATFTINETGLYAIYYVDVRAAGAGAFGVSVNSAQLTTLIFSIAPADRILIGYTTSAGLLATISRSVKLTAGDVVRAHTTGDVDGTGSTNSVFAIRKIGV